MDFSYKCSNCVRTFATEAALNIHHTKIHNRLHTPLLNLRPIKRKPKTKPVFRNRKVLCVLCENEFEKPAIRKHFYQNHDLLLEHEEITFIDHESFTIWKEEEERSTKSKFVKQSGTKLRHDGSVITVYKCHRDGYYRCRGKNLRKLKTNGSNKINGHCPAIIKAIEFDNKIVVKYVKTHMGHSMDLSKLPLTKREREMLAQELKSKNSMEDVLEDVRNSLVNEDVQRLHLLTKKDLFNIAGEFRLAKKTMERKDHETADGWIRQLQQETNAVRFYKPKGDIVETNPEFKKNDFCLIIANDAQIEALKEFGNEIVCVDTCHDSGLFSIIVFDADYQAIPCAFMFCSKVNTAVVKNYFAVIRAAIGVELNPRFFMSDMIESYFNSWTAVNPGAMKHLYCPWYVDWAWQQNFNKIKNVEKRIDVYKRMKTLMNGIDMDDFITDSKRLISDLRESDEMRGFVGYVERFVGGAESWAMSFWIRSGITTTFDLESTHRALKSAAQKDLPISSTTLLHIARDKLLKYYLPDLSDVRLKHDVASGLDLETVSQIDASTYVASIGDDVYTVSATGIDCDCPVLCPDCGSCPHAFRCTCVDSVFHWNMCEHMHLVCLYLKTVQVVEEVETVEEKRSRRMVRVTDLVGSLVTDEDFEALDEFLSDFERNLLERKSGFIESIT